MRLAHQLLLDLDAGRQSHVIGQLSQGATHDPQLFLVSVTSAKLAPP
ncbi:hypothetical protein [Actinophytocola glycyrrhizae]|uniref:Uncharacterized protein n=1 Tax=Actinophytocola glycyrrhizae TaxID=2044873 RepID=A0ABV9RXR2_9PSEU